MKTILTNHGVDWDETMARFVYSEELYMECLEMLIQDENFQTLPAALAQNDLQKAFEAAHTIKGVAANMGLPTLTEAANNLVEPLRQQKNVNYQIPLQTLQNELQNTKNLLNTLKTHCKGGPA